MTLPVNVDATYPDQGDPSRALHQQHHDTIHGVVNDLPAQLALKLDTATATARLPVNVKDYGAMGDGVADDTAEIQAARVVAVASGRPLYIPTGEYRCTAKLFDATTDPVDVFGDGPGRTVLLHEANGLHLLDALGTQAAAVAVTVASAAGATSLTVTSTTGLAAGDVLLIADTSQVIYGNSGRSAAGVAGEMIRVRSVDSGTTLTVRGRLEFGYTTAATITKQNLVQGFSVADLTIRNPTPGASAAGTRGIACTRVQDVSIRNVEMVDLDDDAMRFDTVYGFTVADVLLRDLRDIESANTPYGINCVNTTTHGLVRGVRQQYGRHLFTAGGGTATLPQAAHILVSDCIAVESSQASFDTHPGARFITFDNCESLSGLGYGFQVRGPDCAILNPTVTQATRGIFAVYGADRLRISGGRLTGCDTGVLIQSSEDVLVQGVRIESPTTVGVDVVRDATYAAAMTKVNLIDLDITGNPSTAGINIQFPSDQHRIDSIRIPTATTPLLGSFPLLSDPLGIGIVCNYDPPAATAVGGIGIASRVFYTKAIGSGVVSKIGIYVGAQSGNIAVAVYSNTGVGRGSSPGVRKATSGSIACPAVGYAEVSLGSAITVQPGDWLAIVADNTVATFLTGALTSSTSASIYSGRAAAESAAFPPPATATPGAIFTRSPLLIGVP